MRLGRDDGRHESAEDEDGAGTLLGVAIGAAIGALAWAGLIQAFVWLRVTPSDVLVHVGGALVLVVGAGLVVVALAELGGE